MITNSRPLRVLIVDDSEDTVSSCGELLQLYGHEVRTAESGDEAIAVLSGWEPDIALLDICMPGVSGYALARLICARSAGKPLLVAVTGMSAVPYRTAAEDAGFDRLLVKPVEPDVMTDLLRDYAATLEPGSHKSD